MEISLGNSTCGKYGVCMFFVCFCHAPRPVCCSFEGVYFEQVLCHCLLLDFDAVFRVFFRRDCPFRWAR